MTTIHEDFAKSFRTASAYAVLQGGNYVGRIVFKCPKDGAGRMTCFAQVWGAPMAKGSVEGFGYDKATAAAEKAVKALANADSRDPDVPAHINAWQQAMTANSGSRWKSRLEAVGYAVIVVID